MAATQEAVDKFERALLSLNRLSARSLFSEWSASVSPTEIVEQLVAPALERIGNGWEQGRVALSQVYLSGRICEELVDTILPPADPSRKPHPKMAIAVLQDRHILGKRIVYAALRASGFDLLDFGHGVTVDELVSRALQEKTKVLLISVLMLPSALLVKQVATRLKASGSDARVVVGGAPFRLDEDLWEEVGADAMGRNSGDAISIVSRILGELP